jgi:hypothetical protein
VKAGILAAIVIRKYQNVNKEGVLEYWRVGVME